MQNRRAALRPRQPVATAEEGPAVPPRRAPSPVVVEVRRDGFHWRDAGVGAVATLALVTIAFGLVLVLRDRPETPPATWNADS
jgi:hypothetical protein